MHSRVVASGVFFNHSTSKPFSSAVDMVLGTAGCAFRFFGLGAASAAAEPVPDNGVPLGNSSALRFFWPFATGPEEVGLEA